MGSDDSAVLETRNAAGEETGCLVARGPGKGLFVCSRLACLLYTSAFADFQVQKA